MTFVPSNYARGGIGRPPMVWRNLLFWVLMILLAVILWQMSSRDHSAQGSPLSYSDFMNQFDANNIQTANVALTQNTVDVSGKLKQPPADYRSTVPRDALTALLAKLRQQGADVHVSENARSNTTDFILGIAPIILLFLLWIFMMGRLRKQKLNSPNQPTPGALG